MPTPLRALLLEDNEADVQLIVRALQGDGFDVSWRCVQRESAFQEAVRSEPWDVVIADYSLPSYSAVSALEYLRSQDTDVPFIVVSGVAGEETAVEMVKQGADDYVMKDRLVRLSAAVQRERQRSQERHEYRATKLKLELAEALRQNRSEYELLAETSPSMVFHADRDGGAIYGNDARWTEWTGLPPGSWAGGGWAQAVFEEDRGRVYRSWKRATSERRPWQEELRFRHVHGFLTWVLVRAVPTFDETGEVDGYVGACTDITERKQAEESLRKSQRTILRQLAELNHHYQTAPVGLCLIDRQLRFLRINDRLAAVNGHPASDHIGRTIHDMIPEFAPYIEPRYRQVFETGQPALDMEFEIKGTADLPTTYWLVSYHPLLGSDGTVTAVTTVVQEITQLRESQRALKKANDELEARVEQRTQQLTFTVHKLEAEIAHRHHTAQALAASEAQFRAIFEAAAGMYTTSESGRFLKVNSAFCRFVGYREAELKQRTINDLLVAAESTAAWQPTAANRYAPQVATNREERYRRRDGSIVWGHTTTVWLDSPEGGFGIGMVQDISERKRVEESLRLTQFSVDNSADAIYWADSDANLVYVNHAAMRATLYEHEELLRMSVCDLDTRIPRDRWQRMWTNCQASGHMSFESHLRRKDGSEMPVETTVNFLGFRDKKYLVGFVRDITDRKQAEQSLRENTDLLQEAQRMAHVGHWEWDLATDELTWSQELYRIYGVVPDDAPLSYQRFIDAAHPEDRAALRSACDRSRRSGQPFSIENRILRPDGTSRILHSSGYLIKDKNDQPVKLRGICMDVTERTSEATKFRGLLEAAPDAMVIVDAGGRIVLINRQTEQLFGYGSDELIGRFVEVLVPESLRQKHVEHRTGFVGNPTFRPMGAGLELKGQRRDGTTFPVEVSISPLQLAEGLLVTAAIRDITDRKRAHDDLQRIQIRLAEAQRIGRVGSWEWDLTSGEMWWSDELYRLFGVPHLIFQPSLESMMQCILPDDRPLVREVVQLNLDGDEPFELEYRIRSGEGLVRYLSAQHQVKRDLRGRPIRMLGTAHDITERRQIQAQLRRAERLASLGTLAAGIAHEINNPMSAAWTAAETAKTVKNHRDNHEMLDECLDAVGDAVQRCRVIIDNVLRFARQESSRKTPSDLNEIVRRAIETTAYYTRTHGSLLHVDLAANLPHPTVNGPEIEQVIVNLIRNAVQAGHANAIRLMTEAAPQAVRIRISDDGRGIPKQNLDHIFDPFFTTNDTADGTGLGLAISHGIVEDHEGTIDVESQVGEGTTVTVTLPLTPSSKTTPALSSPAAADRGSPPSAN